MINVKIQVKIDEFKRQLENLQKAIIFTRKKEKSKEFEYFRESVVQRFEYCFESAWKLLKLILEEEYNEQVGSPKETIKCGEKYGYISDAFAWFAILASRNLSTHTYDEKEVIALYHDIQQHLSYFKKFYDVCKKKFK